LTNAPAAYLEDALTSPCPAPAFAIADALARRHPDSAIFLYGSGISVSAAEKATDILFDYYVVAPDYASAISNVAERIAASAIPPNVYYFEVETPEGRLRSKYALLSVEAFERLVSKRTFHSYFWARFAQPCRLVVCPEALRPRMIAAVRSAIETFLRNSQGLADDPQDWRAVWLKGMNASYRAELRAEASDRAERLIASYGAWPERAAALALDPRAQRSWKAAAAWRLRALFGAGLSALRLLKATTTFKGGIDYIAWKVKRHAGVDVAVRPWERRHPFISAPIVAARYYRLREAARRSSRA
jgi:hypothetical protein